MPDRQAMAKAHEEHVAEVLGGTMSKGSGSTHGDADGRHDHFAEFAFAWDCKSTLGKSIGVSVEMLEKLLDQAHGERPLLPLRWYANERLDVAPAGDWYLIYEPDLLEMREKATHPLLVSSPDDRVKVLEQAIEGYVAQEVKSRDKLAQAQERIRDLEMDLSCLPDMKAEMEHLRAQVAQVPELQAEVERLRVLQQAVEHQPVQLDTPLARVNLNQPVPQLPWTIISQWDLPGGRGKLNTAMHFGDDGGVTSLAVDTVRVEPGDAGTEKIFLNDRRIRGCDLYINGHLRNRAGAR